jgi:hypothetical protein
MATAPTIDFLSSAIDQLGMIKARIAELKVDEARLTALVQQSGQTAYDGRLFRATVSEVAERKSLDGKAAEAKLRELGVDGRWFSKNQKTTKAYTTVKIVARKA